MEKSKLLVADDTPANLLLMEAIFANSDVELVMVDSGTAALEALEADEFALALLDAQMPGMDGFEVAAEMAANPDPQVAETPVIIITGMGTDKNLVEAGYESGAIDYLQKPIDPDILRAKTNSFIRIYECRKELQRAIEEQLKTRDKFVSHVAHEMRTPLNAANQFLQILSDGELSGEQEGFLHAAMRNLGDMTSMIGDLMDIFKMGADDTEADMDLEKIDLERLVGEVLLVYPDVELQFAENLPMVTGEARRLRQVLGNLLVNAQRYGGEGEKLVTVKQDGEVVRVEVLDRGPGVPEALREKIFQRLEQGDATKWDSRKGLGLGLYICRRLLEAMGGKIWVEERPGGGAAFCFVIQACPSEARVVLGA